MLTLVATLPAVDIVLSGLRDRKCLIVGPLQEENTTIPDINMTTELKLVFYELVKRLLKPSREDLTQLALTIERSSTVSELCKLLEESTVHDHALAFLPRMLRRYIAQHEDNLCKRDQVCVTTPFVEPYQTTLTVFIAHVFSHVLEDFQERVLVLFVSNVDTVYDLLLPFRKCRTYIVSLSPVDVGTFQLFDEVYTWHLDLRSGSSKIVKALPDAFLTLSRVQAQVRFRDKIEEIESVYVPEGVNAEISREVLSMLREVLFMNLNALRESISQHLGVPKEEVDRTLLYLKKLGLVDIKYLPDGRVVVYVTPQGLVEYTTG